MGTTDQYSSTRKRKWKPGERSKISLMQAFRSAYHEHDARKASEKTDDNETQVTTRSKQRREGVSEDTLRQHLQTDLMSLLDTVQLDAVISLDDAPHVKQSVINFGFPDFSPFSREELTKPHVIAKIRQSLLDHEPRLKQSTLEIKVENPGDETGRRLSIHVSAELVSDPVDVPVDFKAEVDLGAGKLSMSQIRVQT